MMTALQCEAACLLSRVMVALIASATFDSRRGDISKCHGDSRVAMCYSLNMPPAATALSGEQWYYAVMAKTIIPSVTAGAGVT